MNQKSKIGIIGYGAEGKAMMEYLVEHGYGDITICDLNTDHPALKGGLPDGVSVRLGPGYLDDLEDFEVVFRSPGVKYLEPKIQKAKLAGTEISSVTRFFVDQCPCPIIGVTGTKGKGTTCSLLFIMLKKGGINAYLGGNIGKPSIIFLDDLKGDDLVVLEMSSFQLQDMTKSPHYAIFLNTTSDHLDYHVDNDEYMHAKESLIAHQGSEGVAVLNRDYPYFKQYRGLVQGKFMEVSTKEKVKDGAYVRDGKLYAVKDGEATEIMETAEIRLPGVHNLDNAMPATAMAWHLGIKKEAIVETLKEFEGLPHRLQFVREVNGVSYYNDSNATNIYPSMAAVDSFEVPTVLIAGGSSKGLDYREWARKILTRPSLKTVVLIGEVADQMAEALKDMEEQLAEAEGSPTEVLKRHTFKEAIETAKEKAEGLIEAGHDREAVVVMSPAAASFDMFDNYIDRGVQFMEMVRELK